MDLLEALETMVRDEQDIPERAMHVNAKGRTLVSSWIEPIGAEADLGYEVDYISRSVVLQENSWPLKSMPSRVHNYSDSRTSLHTNRLSEPIDLGDYVHFKRLLFHWSSVKFGDVL